ncbi:uncharacterized protein LOC133187488 [Saccostrea echinata]|uniref:uncharacterized protein LOC133187488 n=1 Tax=Saccostrea echinata TaxID=191078 RepID=UPI002A83D64A|nr:uncharacterized protein LOC133187488 [Saccostrea echinata]
MDKHFSRTISLLLICWISSISAVKWPRGTYTLVKPKSGCPPGWLEGWRHQDNEDDDNKNSLADGHHFFGDFGRNMKFYYCTKDPNDINDEGFWPAGNYCILKHGATCPPTGFKSGSIHWDDEDSRNKNSLGGTLPSGSYNKNTRIEYCCRKDGSYTNEILLPTAQPFYLLRFTSQCQLVRGMYVREEKVHFDDEDKNNKNSVSGSYPFGAGGRNHNLYYCYYFPL